MRFYDEDGKIIPHAIDTSCTALGWVLLIGFGLFVGAALVW